jgi:hypothetical protein
MEWRMFFAIFLLTLLLTAIYILAYKINNTSLTVRDASGTVLTADVDLGYY